MRRRKEGISIPMKYKANTDYKTIPESLVDNAIALYTTRPQGLSDFSVMISSDFTTAEMNAIFGVGNTPTASEIAGMKAYKGKETWVGLEPVVINPNDKYYWPDRSGLGRHLHAVNVAYDSTGGVQAGPPANWLCDGVNDYLVFNSATDIVAANGAVSAFVVFQAKASLVANQTIFVISSSSGAKEVIAVYLPSGVVTGYSADSVTGFSAPSSGVTVTPDKWYSVATMYDPSTKKAGISVNGGTIVWGSAITNGTSAPYRISAATNRAITSFFNDRVSEYPIFNKVLTQAEIKQLHNNIASRYPGLTKV